MLIHVHKNTAKIVTKIVWKQPICEAELNMNSLTWGYMQRVGGSWHGIVPLQLLLVSEVFYVTNADAVIFYLYNLDIASP